MNKLTDFTKGIITGFALSSIILGLILAVNFANKRDKELIDYAKKQMEVEALREDYTNRPPAEFVDTVPGVRRAADGAAAEFERKRDEALQRFRSKRTD